MTLPLKSTTVSPLPVESPSPGLGVEEIYSEYVGMVWSALRGLGVPEANIEDAVQDVFLVVHRRLAEFEGRSSLKTWLYGIALRVAKDYRRSQSRHDHKVERMTESFAFGPPAQQVPEAERSLAMRTLYAILSELDEQHREVLVMVELQELPMREAATALNLHIRACQRRLRAAHAEFEKKLARYLSPNGRQIP